MTKSLLSAMLACVALLEMEPAMANDESEPSKKSLQAMIDANTRRVRGTDVPDDVAFQMTPYARSVLSSSRYAAPPGEMPALFNTVCDARSQQVARNRDDAAEIGRLMAEDSAAVAARRRDFFESALATASADARVRIDREIAEVKERMRHSEIDFQGLAADAPETLLALVDGGCARVAALKSKREENQDLGDIRLPTHIED